MNQLFSIALMTLFVHMYQDDGVRSTIQVGASTRSYILYAPNHKDHERVPLFVVLHAQNGTAKGVFQKKEIWSRLRSRAILVFPDGIDGHWSCSTDNDHTKNDVDFLKTLVDTLISEYHVSSTDIHLIGIHDSYCVVEDFDRSYGHGKIKVHHATPRKNKASPFSQVSMRYLYL